MMTLSIDQPEVINSCIQDILSQLQEEGITFSNLSVLGKIKQVLRNFPTVSEVSQKRIYSEFHGYGPLELLLSNPQITEIIISAMDCIHYERNGVLVRMQEDCFRSAATYELFCQKIFREIGIEPTIERPLICASWGPHRIHIAAPPVSSNLHFTIRLHKTRHLSINELETMGTATGEEIRILLNALNARDNILVFGETGSGKTTLIRSLLQSLPENERVIVIEDTQELGVPNFASVNLVGKNSSDWRDPIDLTQLVRESLRMRPDRIVLGEVRGSEAKDLLLALSSGHTGSLGTIHANTPKDALARLEMFVQMGAPQWDKSIVRRLIFDSLSLVIGLERTKEGKRRVKCLHRLSSIEEFGITLDPIADIN